MNLFELKIGSGQEIHAHAKNINSEKSKIKKNHLVTINRTFSPHNRQYEREKYKVFR